MRMSRGKRVLMSLCAVTTVAAASQSAIADTSEIQDARDSGSTMDLASAAHGHGETPRVLRHSMSTFDPWTNEEFIYGHFYFWLRDGDRSPDRVLYFYRNPDDSFAGEVHVVVGGPDCGKALGYCELGAFRGYAKAYRSDDRSLVAELPRHLLKKRLAVYRWKAFLGQPCNAPEGAVCSPPPPDTHPGRVLHDLR